METSVAPGWDLPTRAFHWSLAILVVISFVTGKAGGGWLEWHMRSGYAILTLLLFRISWGLLGPTRARFGSFVRGPAAALAYTRRLATGDRVQAPGHNPLGGWMVIAMLAMLLVQAATGLFSNDESSHSGPLAQMVSNATVDRMSVVHSSNQWLLVAAVGIHVAAIAAYHWILRIHVAAGMIRGPASFVWRALALLVPCAFAVYAIVVLLPGVR